MPVAILCPHCDRTLRLPDQLFDKPAQCPLCSGAFHVRWRRLRHPERESGPSVPPANEPDRLPCRFCNQPIRPEALKCPHCRRWLNTES